MRTGPWVAVGIGAGVLACPPGRGPEPGAVNPCHMVVAQDSVRAYASGDSVYLKTQGDTLPKPFSPCIAIYAKVNDTLPKP